jgi:hypothetical protein
LEVYALWKYFRSDDSGESKPVCNFGSKGEKGRRKNIRVIFEEGETLQYRSTGRIFEVKRRSLYSNRPAMG